MFEKLIVALAPRSPFIAKLALRRRFSEDQLKQLKGLKEVPKVFMGEFVPEIPNFVEEEIEFVFLDYHYLWTDWPFDTIWLWIFRKNLKGAK